MASVTGPWRGPDKMTICLPYVAFFSFYFHKCQNFALNGFHYELAKLFIKQLNLIAFCLCHDLPSKVMKPKFHQACYGHGRGVLIWSKLYCN